MADTKDPVRQLFEVAIYAPIGLMLLARRELPALTAAGKTRVESQITLAKFIGRIAVTRGTQELKRRLDAVEARRRGDGSVVDTEATEATDATDATNVFVHVPPPESVTSLPDAIVAAVVAAEIASEIASETTAGSADPLPIDGYDSLAASQVVTRLVTLTPNELDAIHAHELSHRNRRTILGKISQLQAR